MTPDLTTPEGRAALRAIVKTFDTLRAGRNLSAADGYRENISALLDILDAETERSAALAREIIALRSDLDDALVSVIKNQCHIDDLEATIERLTAPVTDADLEAIYIFHDPNIERLVLRDVLDTFIASRKEPAP